MTVTASSFMVYLAHYFIARTLYTGLGHSAPAIGVVLVVVVGVVWLVRRRRRRGWR